MSPPLDRINRKQRQNPIKIRSHDNDLSAIKKLCKAEWARQSAQLPPVEEDPFFYEHGGAETNAVGTRIPEAVPLTYGTGIILHFNEQTLTPTPETNVDPRPQQEGHGIGISYITPVYNAGVGQDRYVTPHTTTPDYSITFVGAGAEDMSVGVVDLITAGSTYVVETHLVFEADDTFTVTITIPPRPPLWEETTIVTDPVTITGDWQQVDDGMGGSIWIMFDAVAGHGEGDTFTFMVGGGEPVMMGGGGETEATSTVFKVDSDDDYAELVSAEKLFCFPLGKMSVWMQGFGDDSADGNRNYYIIDIGHEFILYYEYEAGVTSRLVWYPNVSSGYSLTLDIADGIVGDEESGYFGFIPRKLTLVWDYSTQVFEMYYDGYRAESVSAEYIPAPDVMSLPTALGNSLRRDIYGGGGNENAYQYFDEWTFTKLAPGLMEVTAIDGVVMQSLIPVHNGNYLTAGCGESMTPINLGDHLTPFDHIYGRIIHAECMITPNTADIVFDNMGEPTGFPNRTATTISWSDAGPDRTLTIAPTGAFFTYFIAGVEYTKTGSESVQITDTDGLWVIYYDGDTLTALHDPTHDQIHNIILNTAWVAIVYWNTAQMNEGALFDERHGLTMDGMTHLYLHETIGTAYDSGLGLGDFVISDGADNEDSQFSNSAGEIFDEDIEHDIDAVNKTTGLEIWYLDTAVWRWTTNAGYSILTTGSGRMAYNTGGALVEVANNRYALCHVFATNHTDEKLIAVVGQNQYLNLNAAQTGAVIEIGTLVFGDLPTEEMKPIGTVIFQTRNSYGNAVKSRVVQTEAGDNYIDWRTNPIAQGVPAAEHGSLSGLADNDHSQYAAAFCVIYDDLVASSTDGLINVRVLQNETRNEGDLVLQVDVPRTISITVIGDGTTDGDITINGISADNDALSVTKSFTDVPGLGGETQITDEAVARVTSVVVTNVAGGAGTYIVGWTDTIGLPNYPFSASTDVYKVKDGQVDINPTNYTISATYGTINIGGFAAIINHNSYTIWYKPL